MDCFIAGDTFLQMNSKVSSEEDLMSSSYIHDPLVREAVADPFVKQMMVFMKQGANDQVQRYVSEYLFEKQESFRVFHSQTLIHLLCEKLFYPFLKRYKHVNILYMQHTQGHVEFLHHPSTQPRELYIPQITIEQISFES